MVENVIFVGGRELGARCLCNLIAREINVVAVLCREDEYAAEGAYDSVRDIAKRNDIACFVSQHDLIKACDKSDYGLCVMYPHLLSAQMLAIPQFGFYNFHGAPLPQYRGCMGHIWAILNGEKQYCVTAHKMAEKFDDGPILESLAFPVAADETGLTLHQKAVDMTFRLFFDVVDMIERGADLESMLAPQDGSKARYYTKQIPRGAKISWDQSACDIDRFIRALIFKNVLPPFTLFEGKKIHISAIGVIPRAASARPGTILDCGEWGMEVATQDYAVKILRDDLIVAGGVFGLLKKGMIFEE